MKIMWILNFIKAVFSTYNEDDSPPPLIVHYYHLEKVNFAENVLNLT